MARRLSAADLQTYFAFTEVANLMRYEVEGQLRRDGGLSLVAFGILAALDAADGGRQRMTDVADRLVHSRGGLTYQAKDLEARGLVERRPDPADDRGTVLAITRSGRALVRRVMPGHQDVVRRVLLDPLDAADATALRRIVTGLRDRLRAEPPRSAAPRR